MHGGLNVIAKELNGPSWGPKQNKIDIDELQKKIDQVDHVSNNAISNSNVEIGRAHV